MTKATWLDTCFYLLPEEAVNEVLCENIPIFEAALNDSCVKYVVWNRTLSII